MNHRITLKAASASTGIPVRTLQRWVHSEWLTGHGLCGMVLVDRYELDVLVGTRGTGGRLPKGHARTSCAGSRIVT